MHLIEHEIVGYNTQCHGYRSLSLQAQYTLLKAMYTGGGCSGFEPGFYVYSVFDLSCLVSPYLFSALS